jgi:hypothetical protein
MMSSTPAQYLAVPHADSASAEANEDSDALPVESPISPMLEAVEPEVASDAEDSEPETIELPSGGVLWPNDPASGAGGLYSNSLWHGVPRVLQQAEAGRVASKALVQFVQGKAQLDREYASRLRALAETYSQKLSLPVRPKSAHTFQAACCALRNLHVNVASNSETLADQMEEQVADVFLEEAQDLSAVLKPLVSSTKATQARYSSAMTALEQTKRDLFKACQELDDAKHAPTHASNDPMDFLTQMIRSTPESLAKRVREKDAAHVEAIRMMREMRQQHDAQIQGHLAELEAMELKRMKKSLASMSAWTRIYSQCYTSHLKNIASVHQMIQKSIQPVEDLKAFVTETVKDLRGITAPPSLPVYRLVKGHPDWKSRRRASAAAGGGGGSEDEEVEELTDSEAEDAAGEEEITLSSAEEMSDVEDPVSDDDAAVTQHSSIHAAVAARSSKPASLTPAQSTAILSTLSSLASLPEFSTSSAVSPSVNSTEQEERATAEEACKLEKGRAAVAKELKRLLKRGSKTESKEAETESKEDAEATAAAEDDENTSAEISPLLVSAAALDGLTSFLTVMFDSAAPSMHVQPILSVMRTAKWIQSSETQSPAEAAPVAASKEVAATPTKKGKKGRKSSGQQPSPSQPTDAGADADTSAAASSTSFASSPSTLHSRLLSHPLFSSPGFYSAAFLSSLQRAWNSHSQEVEVKKWHGAKETRERENRQREIAAEVLEQAAMEAQEMGRVEDQVIVDLVAKMANAHGLTTEQQQKLVSELDCFKRLGIEEMPLLAGTAKPLVSAAAPSPTTASGLAPAAALPVAQPVNVSPQK